MVKEDFIFRQAQTADAEAIATYFCKLGAASKKRFGPHAFELASIRHILQDTSAFLVFIAIHLPSDEVAAYAVLKKGSLQHDRHRLIGYGITPDEETDCTLAPSVADAWQHAGVGSELHHFIENELLQAGFRRIILWGGVQADNYPAVRFYQKHQYQLLGEFEYNGLNYDMIRLLKENTA